MVYFTTLPVDYLRLYEVNFSLRHAMKAHRVNRDILLLSLNLGGRYGWVVNATPRPFYFQEITPSTHLTGGWVSPRGLSGRLWK
jgi:hypothetical protein